MRIFVSRFFQCLQDELSCRAAFCGPRDSPAYSVGKNLKKTDRAASRHGHSDAARDLFALDGFRARRILGKCFRWLEHTHKQQCDNRINRTVHSDTPAAYRDRKARLSATAT